MISVASKQPNRRYGGDRTRLRNRYSEVFILCCQEVCFMAKSQKVVLGVDIGGTKIAAGLVNSEGKILYSSRTRMVAKKSAQEGVQAVRTAVDDVLKATAGQKVSAIGVSVPGWVDSAQGMLLSATNLPCWRNFPLAQEIETCYRLPTHLANDANAAG